MASSSENSSLTQKQRRTSVSEHVKDKVDLYLFANIIPREFDQNTFASLPSKAQDLIKRLRSINREHEIIPTIIRKRVETAANDIVHEHNLITEYHLEKSDALYELHRLQEVIENANFCKAECLAKAAWNSLVHERIFDIALDESAGTTVKALSTTTATITPGFAPKISTFDGDKTVSKTVDFCLTIEPEYPEQVDKICFSQPIYEQWTINQSNYTPLCHRPIAVAVITNVDTTGEVELGIWTKAWLNRICLLRGIPMDTDPSSPPLPLISIRGHDWYVLIAYYECQTADSSRPELILWGEQPIGNTRDLIGAYKLLRSIRLLADWADGAFRRYIDTVVVPDALRVWCA
ncbi:hypothetical protein EV127DRAFT_499045 [Xylaria flabelliformis]|nr:hypothetical protein EV127DRAFT_499045 [Xylaria flabelliformis]